MGLIFDDAYERYDSNSGAMIVRAHDAGGRELFAVITEEALRVAPQKEKHLTHAPDLYRQARTLFRALIDIKFQAGEITASNEIIVRPYDLGF